MPPMPPRPTIYEINTWVWLHELSQAQGRRVTLGDVPQERWDALAALRVDAIWLMGVWQRSPAGTHIANQNPSLLAEFRHALPDFELHDNVGSPYCIRRYVVDDHLGGPAGLAAARQALAERGLRLILDFVPNHVAPDHPWALEHPEYFIQGDAGDLARLPTEFIEVGSHILARGRDPYFAPWQDVLQLNAFAPGLRRAALDTLIDIASQCDGLRCDMAMLLLNSVFQRTWAERAGSRPGQEYWQELIPAVKAHYPEFLFIAEAYWDLEWELQQRGFDYCYDKRLYDRLLHESAEPVRLHLLAGLDYQDKLVRFIENHDEPRAAAVFTAEKERLAALLTATLPGARLFHEGQFEGRQVKLPVFLGRRPAEPPDLALRKFYRGLLQAIHAPLFHRGAWQLLQLSGWPDNLSHRHLLAWSWSLGKQRALIVANLSDRPAQARLPLPWRDLSGKTQRLRDPLNGQVFERSGDELIDPGLFIDLPPWGLHFFRF